MSPRFECDASSAERARWLNAMANMPVLDRASTATAELLLKSACFRRYAPGAQIYREGERATAVYFLVEGVLRVYQVSDRGVEYTPKIFGAPSHFGDLPMLAGFDGYRSSIAALTPVVAATVPSTLLAECLERDHGLCIAWLRNVARKHAMTMDADRQGVFGGLIARVSNVLLSYAELFGAPESGLMAISHPLSYQRLAEQVGCTRRSAISVMQTLVQQGAARTAGEGWAIRTDALREHLAGNSLGVAYSDQRRAPPDEHGGAES